MRRFAKRLLRDSRGNVVLEFAAVSPIIVMMVFGLLQVSMLLYANAIMRGALGEGARLASVYRTPAVANGWSGPPQTEICNKVLSSALSLGNADVTALSLTRDLNGTANALTLAMSYNVDLDFIFFDTSPTLTATRRVYLESEPDFGSPAVACSV